MSKNQPITLENTQQLQIGRSARFSFRANTNYQTLALAARRFAATFVLLCSAVLLFA